MDPEYVSLLLQLDKLDEIKSYFENFISIPKNNLSPPYHLIEYINPIKNYSIKLKAIVINDCNKNEDISPFTFRIILNHTTNTDDLIKEFIDKKLILPFLKDLDIRYTDISKIGLNLLLDFLYTNRNNYFINLHLDNTNNTFCKIYLLKSQYDQIENLYDKPFNSEYIFYNIENEIENHSSNTFYLKYLIKEI